jgi:hypothetical protein
MFSRIPQGVAAAKLQDPDLVWTPGTRTTTVTRSGGPLAQSETMCIDVGFNLREDEVFVEDLRETF